MFLTTCAVCAKALDDDIEAARRCEPCGTRYCSEECEREGRDHDCDAIVRAGGAEAAYVSRTSADAVAEAIASCAEETAGKACYICLEVEDDEGHACVRGCACRGEAGFAHLSCLARNAQATRRRCTRTLKPCPTTFSRPSRRTRNAWRPRGVSGARVIPK